MTIYLGYDNIPDINNRKENMEYYILRKWTMSDGTSEYDTDQKANKGYKDISEVAKKVVALENLNDNDNVKYIVVSENK